MVIDMGVGNAGIPQYTRNFRDNWRFAIPPWMTLVMASLLVYLANFSLTCGSNSVISDTVSTSSIFVLNTTQTSVILKWADSKSVEFPEDLIYKIEYKSQWDSEFEQWHTINISGICTSSLTSSFPYMNCRQRDTRFNYFNVTDLKYPFTSYDLCIYERNSSISDWADKWTALGCITLKTKPTIPKRPPQTTAGSFDSMVTSVKESTRNVTIYWQKINDYEKCGDLFEYRIVFTYVNTNNETITDRGNETHAYYARFEGLNTTYDYNFSVYSANEEGLSTEYSTVFVPRESNKYRKPSSLTKMELPEQGIVELSWKNVGIRILPTAYQPTDYTLYWCENDKDSHECSGNLYWMHIPYSESSYNVTALDPTKNYRFAISTNGKTSSRNNSLHQSTDNSSGMIWDSCTLLPNKIVGKMENIWFSYISSTFFEINWKLDCSDKIGTILGYRLFYCPIVSMDNTTCAEPKTIQLKGGEIAHRSRTFSYVRNLKPYTTYMITVALVTSIGEGMPSDPLFKTTLEGAPDIRNFSINVTGISNTSIDLQWLPPKSSNGIIRDYIVNYYLDDAPQHQKQQDLIDLIDEQNFIFVQRNITVHDTKCRLENLDSNRIYNITITACTIKCSERSLPIQVRTAVVGSIPYVQRSL